MARVVSTALWAVQEFVASSGELLHELEIKRTFGPREEFER